MNIEEKLPIPRENLTPMMQQYYDTKINYLEDILMYQLGDFYEMFFTDAKIASRALELTLTARDCGNGEKAPMCGIPQVAIENYVPKLIKAGYNVAICAQVSEPVAGSKTLVQRQITKVVTPGTMTDNIEDKKNNYIMSLSALSTSSDKFDVGVAYADITTGLLRVLSCNSLEKLDNAITRISPSEVIVNSKSKEIEKNISSIKLGIVPKFKEYVDYAYEFKRSVERSKKHFGVNSLTVFDLEPNDKSIVTAVGGLLEYLSETQKRTLSNINKISIEKTSDYLYLDAGTRRNLELTENMITRKKYGSLLWLLDNTKSSMGARKLRSYIEQPLYDKRSINNRLDAVEYFTHNIMQLNDIKELLKDIQDIERLSGKIAYGSIAPKECNTLVASLKLASELKSYLSNNSISLIKTSYELIHDESELVSLLSEAIIDNAPMLMKDGGFIKTGYNDELDTLRNIGDLGGKWLIEYETKVKEQTGIKNLKVSYNRVFGYYFEVTKSQIGLVPLDWCRKQTTVNSERYTTEELKKVEDKILNSETDSLKLEFALYNKIKEYLKTKIVELQEISEGIATIDAICSLASIAIENNYTKPTIIDGNRISIIDGRHPVVEALLQSNQFVPNDTILDNNENSLLLITGPNMAGKSTYMRQVAIITLMAHIGSFVPAKSADISLCDRIFTRIGASDDLAFGQSTFMVEMTEVANILNNATENSLLLLDEIGRGTSTYDGLSIAWSVIEYLTKHLNAMTLFATHYHELTELEGKLKGVKNYRVLIKELNNEVVFLHKIVRGSANKSFGIEVASIAGLPKELIDRAKEILKLEESSNRLLGSNNNIKEANSTVNQNVNVTEVINVLSEMDMDTVSPIVAFATLQNLVDKVKK